MLSDRRLVLHARPGFFSRDPSLETLGRGGGRAGAGGIAVWGDRCLEKKIVVLCDRATGGWLRAYWLVALGRT